MEYNMKNIAIITAKGSNRSIRNKNLIAIGDTTFLGHQILAAKEAKYIDEVFISTECSLIKAECLKYDAKIIERPKELAQAFTNHGDVIIHAAKEASSIVQESIDTITILLGNTVMIRACDIDNAINVLQNDFNADSAMTVWKAQDDHPYRAMNIGENGYLKSYVEVNNVDTNRQSYPDVYFYDQGPWCVRYSSLMKSEQGKTGPACWWWMGNNSIPILRNWITGKDIHTQLDVEISKCWLKNKLWQY
jgi:N-acylneuraminate cytidylyltransferase